MSALLPPHLHSTSTTWLTSTASSTGGDTYGFLSEQGIIGQLGNASFSVVSNEDYEGSFVTLSVACRVITAAAKALKGQTLDLHCRS